MALLIATSSFAAMGAGMGPPPTGETLISSADASTLFNALFSAGFVIGDQKQQLICAHELNCSLDIETVLKGAPEEDEWSCTFTVSGRDLQIDGEAALNLVVTLGNYSGSINKTSDSVSVDDLNCTRDLSNSAASCSF